MQRFDSVTSELPARYEDAFAFIVNPENLPRWALGFREADETSALLAPGGVGGPFRIGLKTVASIETGLIDWYMDMPDGSRTRALSRVIDLLNGRCCYTFMFFAPPIPDDQVAASLSNQKRQIEKEFDNLVRLLA